MHIAHIRCHPSLFICGPKARRNGGYEHWIPRFVGKGKRELLMMTFSVLSSDSKICTRLIQVYQVGLWLYVLCSSSQEILVPILLQCRRRIDTHHRISPWKWGKDNSHDDQLELRRSTGTDGVVGGTRSLGRELYQSLHA